MFELNKSCFNVSAKIIVTLSMCLFLSAGIHVYAQNITALDGDIGRTSSARINISLTVNGALQLTNVDDINFVASSRDETIRVREELCVGGPVNALYTVSVATEARNGYFLTNANRDLLPFDLLFYPNIESDSFEQLRESQPSNQYSISRSILDCSVGDSSAVELIVRPQDLSETVFGVFTGTLVLTVAII